MQKLRDFFHYQREAGVIMLKKIHSLSLTYAVWIRKGKKTVNFLQYLKGEESIIDLSKSNSERL